MDVLHWGAQFDVILEEFHIKLEKVTAVVVASDRADVYDSLVAKGLTILPCFSFAMQVNRILCIIILQTTIYIYFNKLHHLD